MTNSKKKCWRDKVTAEITLTHVQAFAQEVGTHLSASEVEQFLNNKGLAQNVWIHMMTAAEQFIKSSLQDRVTALPPGERRTLPAPMIQ